MILSVAVAKQISALMFAALMCWSLLAINGNQPDELVEIPELASVSKNFDVHTIVEWSYQVGVNKPGLSFRVELEDREYLLGEPVWVRGLLVNESDKPITISYGRYEGLNEILFDIQDAQGNQIDRTTYERDTTGPRAVTIAPQHCLVQMFNLLDEYDIHQSGEYSISASYNSDGECSRFDKAGKYLGKDQFKKCQLSQKLKNLRVVNPTRKIDQVAVQLLDANAARNLARSESNVHFRFRYAYGTAAVRDLIQNHGESRYAGYAHYDQAIRALYEFEDTKFVDYAKKALTDLSSIDTADCPKLFQEYVHLHLIEAHFAAGSKRKKRTRWSRVFENCFRTARFFRC